MTDAPVDLGSCHSLRFTEWKPDRALNPQYADIPDYDRVGALIDHLTPTGESCTGSILFDLPGVQSIFGRPVWSVHSWFPLSLSPSVLCSCGDHGWIQNGRWVKC